jgi:hypothetical protein
LEGSEKPKTGEQMISQPVESSNNNNNGDVPKQKKVKDDVYVRKWMRTRHAIMFRLSNKVV